MRHSKGGSGTSTHPTGRVALNRRRPRVPSDGLDSTLFAVGRPTLII
jgi:hypothetical protein